MREIKFRAWDKVDKIMYYDIQDGITFDDGSRYTFDQFLNPTSDDYHKWIIEQFIGIKDKGGREIYEGDLLQSTATKVAKPRIKTCEWEGIGFDPFVADCEHSGDGWHWKVIGDIHTEELKEKHENHPASNRSDG
ncbi:hypothetical protein LCGC14_1066750 [marine sediment metagenome]|uniref:YopX protein domain-containing protein n=1 Tax=marine sediment metagenome TaxID=412755 RepID=A0A0F9MPA4_9ZZZZ